MKGRAIRDLKKMEKKIEEQKKKYELQKKLAESILKSKQDAPPKSPKSPVKKEAEKPKLATNPTLPKQSAKKEDDMERFFKYLQKYEEFKQEKKKKKQVAFKEPLAIKKNNQEISREDINLILNLFNLKKFVDAKKIINQKIIKHPNSSILFNILGAIYAEENEIDKAIDYYNESIKAKNDFPDVYKEIGLLQLKIEKNEEAKKNLKKYLKLAKNPQDAAIIESYLN